MVESKPSPGLRSQLAAQRRLRVAGGGRAHRSRIRSNIYTGLLIFIVVIGVPLLGIPSVRNRLYARVHSVYGALGPLPFKPSPAWAKVGENRYPVPVEFERPRPQASGVILLPNTVIRMGGDVHVGESARAQAKVETSREPEAADSAAPEFRQGKSEQEAYDLLLKSNEAIAGLIKGNSAALRFKSWSGAKVADDAFLVNVSFLQVSDNTEVQYIWRINLVSKEITPLSRNARALSK